MEVIENALIGQVRARVDADEQLDVAAGLLVLAALEGDEALDRALLGEAADRQAPASAVTAPTHSPARRAFLDTISVQGFRGIGAGCDLSIAPGAGLTLVVGRNGSGKSSLAEALELLLTGENRRWEDRSAVWKAGWRNLHWTGPAVVAAKLAVEGQRQPLTVRREWPPGSDLAAGVDSADGVRGDDAHAALAWDEAITIARPSGAQGAATRRHLVLDVSVDGTDGQALGVMSQGENHSLALSLFLPRVLLPDSPFGFVVIDDPVQAMVSATERPARWLSRRP